MNCRECVRCISLWAGTSLVDFEKQPTTLVFPNIGSRDGTTRISWDSCGRSLVICGCFAGTIGEFIRVVKDYHGENSYGKRYLDLVDQVMALMEV